MHGLFFFVFSVSEQCIDESTPQKRQNSAQEAGALSVFPRFFAQCTDENSPLNNKIAHSKRGQRRIFHTGFFVKISGFRGGYVINQYFIIFSAEQLARRPATPAAFHSNVPLRQHVRLLPAIKNSLPLWNPVRLHFLYLPSRRVTVIGVRVSGGGRFCVGCRLSLSCRRKFRSGPWCM